MRFAKNIRGCAVVQLPTSLLAMVDSSVRGKCAVDLKTKVKFTLKGQKVKMKILGLVLNPEHMYFIVNTDDTIIAKTSDAKKTPCETFRCRGFRPLFSTPCSFAIIIIIAHSG